MERKISKYNCAFCNVKGCYYNKMEDVKMPTCPTKHEKDNLKDIEKEYKQYEKDCAAFIDIIPFSTYDCPVNVKCVYYMRTKRRVDLVNLEEATLDVLVKYGIILDDNVNIVASMDGSCVKYDKENPRTEIDIDIL